MHITSFNPYPSTSSCCFNTLFAEVFDALSSSILISARAICGKPYIIVCQTLPSRISQPTHVDHNAWQRSLQEPQSMVLVTAVNINPQPPLARLQYDIRFTDLQLPVFDDASLNVVQGAFQLKSR